MLANYIAARLEIRDRKARFLIDAFLAAGCSGQPAENASYTILDIHCKLQYNYLD